MIYYLAENENWIIALLTTCFQGVPGLEKFPTFAEGDDPVLGDDFDVWLVKGVLDGVSRIILTQVGDRPEKVMDRSLIDEMGEPKAPSLKPAS